MTAALIDLLSAHKALAGVPRQELEWLAHNATFHQYAAGTVVATPTRPVNDFNLMIMFTGQLAVYINRVNGRQKVSESHGGDVTGLMPYSRLKQTIGEVIIEADSDVAEVRPDLFAELTRECPNVTAVLVHAMLDRARLFNSTDWQNEKMVSLGRLAAGLAHELNNPASAVARSAKLLSTVLPEVENAARALGAAQMTEDERARFDEMRARSFVPATTGVFSAIERSDREDVVTTWLEEHDVDVNFGEALAESGMEVGALDELADALNPDALRAAIRSIAADFTARSLASEIDRAASRIYDLVSSVKRFTYMDRAAVAEPFDIAQSLTDTVAVLASKAKAKSVMVRLELANDLPRVKAHGGELNQVWSNLVGNAIDAVAQTGTIVVSAALEGDKVVVRFVDDGPGIPADIKGRIFDPFFTTKPMGQGTGLGLDIAKRVVEVRHEGRIDVDSVPGRTEFRVTLPAYKPTV